MDDAETAAGAKPTSAHADLPERRVTINRITAWNMAYFRKVAGLTGEELGARLGWSKAVVSAAERSWDGKRIRQFTVDDLVAIALALGVPVLALLLPPQDAGVAARYVLDTEPGQPEVASLLPRLAQTYGDDSDALTAFRQRLMALGASLHDPDAAEALAQQIVQRAFASARRVEADAKGHAERVTNDARARADALEREAQDRYVSRQLAPSAEQADQAIADAIADARRMANETLGLARREADDVLTKAREQSERITSDAVARAESLERDAQERHRQAMGRLQSREELEKQVADLREFERTYRIRLIRYHDEALRELVGVTEAESESEANPKDGDQ